MSFNELMSWALPVVLSEYHIASVMISQRLESAMFKNIVYGIVNIWVIYLMSIITSQI